MKGDNMDKIGVIKEFDKLGRLVIPKEMRQLFCFKKSVEVIVTEEGVLIRNPEYKLVKNEDSLRNDAKEEKQHARELVREK